MPEYSKERAQFISRLSAAIAQIDLGHPLRVAIDGVDGVGKTTLANELVEPIQQLGRETIRASVDSFHNPREIRYGRGRWSPEGYFYDSFDYKAVTRVVLEPLGPSGDRHYRAAMFDYRADSPVVSPLCQAPRQAVLLFDGVFLLRPELIAMWDLKIFLDVTFANADRRSAIRDLGVARTPESIARYVDGQKLYLRLCRPKEVSDLLVDYNDLSRPTIVRQ